MCAWLLSVPMSGARATDSGGIEDTSPPGRARFPRSSRLVEAAQFKRVFAKPVRIKATGLLVYVRASKRPSARLGLAISKRCCRRAVDRNKLKRIARESFRAQVHRLPAVDIIVLCAPQVVKLGNQSLFAGLDRAWKKILGNEWLPS